MTEIFCCSYAHTDEGGGIYRFLLSEEGKLSPAGCYPCDLPIYAIGRGEDLHVLLRAPFSGSAESGYFRMKKDFSGATPLVGTQGDCGCHLAIAGDDFFAVNYQSGNLTKNGKILVSHHGSGPNPDRQEGPHTHCTCLSTDGKFLFVTDLGEDRVYTYDLDLREVAVAAAPPAFGVRHLCASKDGRHLYAANELVPSVSAYRVEKNGALVLLDTLLCPSHFPSATGAAIRLSEDGRRLYFSIRGDDAVAVIDLSADGEGMALLQIAPAGGAGPRDVTLTPDGKFLLVSNERSHNTAVFRVENDGTLGEMTDSVAVRGSLCTVTE